MILALIVASSLGYFLLENPSNDCDVLHGKMVLTSQLTPRINGAITTFQLPSPDRIPNGVIVAPDNSVWFGEQGVPGIGHFYPNGTLVEYAWPFNYPGKVSGSQTCTEKTAIWTLALWDGRVWAGDERGNQLVGLDPATGSVKAVKLNGTDVFPYGLTVGPENDLWFSELFSSKIGRVDSNGNLTEYSLPNGNRSTPAEIAFANSTVGYYVDAGVPGLQPGGVYQFNPQKFVPTQVGAGMRLYSPSSVSLGSGGVWVTQHGAASIAFYDLGTKGWTIYPTSTVGYADTTLPYFVRVNGSKVWFNEHYGDRIAVIDFAAQSLTEYSIQTRRPTDLSQITNTLTLGLGRDKVWFAEFTGNTIGFVDASYKPNLTVGLSNSQNLRLLKGQTMNFTLTLSDSVQSRLMVQVSDSESFTSVPKMIGISPNLGNVSLTRSSEQFLLTIRIDSSVLPGDYTVVLTATDGLVYRSAFLKVEVLP